QIGNNWWIALTWCLALSTLGHRWSKTQFDRDPK
ncbi:ABC transporter permease, partial [Streptomyces fagopyri]